MSLFSHLECSVPCGAPPLDPHGVHHLCACGAPLLARYDLERARCWSRATLKGRVPTMWRYRELMPLFDGEDPVTLGEGFTPLVHAKRLGSTIGLDRLYVKDESLNPTNSFKARGQSAAITRAKFLGAKTIALPTAGNAGNAAAAYSSAAGLACEVFIPKDAKRPFVDECRLYGAHVTLVDGLITDAGRMAAEKGAPLGWYDVSTLKEPYRIEGKKTMGYELAEEGRNSVRQVRRDMNDRLKKLLKDHKISEDDEKKGLDEVQRLTDNYVKQIDELQKKKDQELLGK